MNVRLFPAVAVLVGLVLLGLGPASANASPGPVNLVARRAVTVGSVQAWHIDLLVSYRAARTDSAAAVQWSTAGSVARWEVDLGGDALAVSWVDTTGNFGGFTYLARLSGGTPHRVHLDARQAGPAIVLVLTVSGTAIWPITVPGRLGPIVELTPSPKNPVRHASVTASVANVTVWNQ